MRAAPKGFELHAKFVKASNDRIRGRIEHHHLARKRMKQDAYFRDQDFMLVFLDWSQGMFVDAEEIRPMITDSHGKSLVISARSSALARQGDCFMNSNIFESHSLYSSPNLFVCHQLFDDDSQLLESLVHMRTQNGLETSSEFKAQYVQEVRQAGRTAQRSFANQLIVLAYDDKEEMESAAPVLLVKRGGLELVVEYLLSAFNGGNTTSRSAQFHDFICDDGQTRQFDFSLLQDEAFPHLFTRHFEVDIDGFPCDMHRSIYNINESALIALRSRFTCPERIARILTTEQVGLLRAQIRGELLAQSDFIGLELFQQTLPDSRVEEQHVAKRRHAGRLSAQGQEWDAWAKEEGIIPPDGDSRW